MISRFAPYRGPQKSSDFWGSRDREMRFAAHEGKDLCMNDSWVYTLASSVGGSFDYAQDDIFVSDAAVFMPQ